MSSQQGDPSIASSLEDMVRTSRAKAELRQFVSSLAEARDGFEDFFQRAEDATAKAPRDFEKAAELETDGARLVAGLPEALGGNLAQIDQPLRNHLERYLESWARRARAFLPGGHHEDNSFGRSVLLIPQGSKSLQDNEIRTLVTKLEAHLEASSGS